MQEASLFYVRLFVRRCPFVPSDWTLSGPEKCNIALKEVHTNESKSGCSWEVRDLYGYCRYFGVDVGDVVIILSRLPVQKPCPAVRRTLTTFLVRNIQRTKNKSSPDGRKIELTLRP